MYMCIYMAWQKVKSALEKTEQDKEDKEWYMGKFQF